MIIDCHCHVGKGDGLTGPWDSTADIRTYLRRASRAGIHRTVLFATFHSDYAEANRYVGRVVLSRPDRFYGFAFVHPDRDRGRVYHMVTVAVREYGFVGIKVHRNDGGISREICEVAQAYNLPILYDVMGEVAHIELLATEYPKVLFIIPHLGSFADDWKAQRSFLDQLERHPNIYTDTSGVRRFDLLVEAVRRCGVRKILFGSDGPWLHPAVELAKIRALELSAADEHWILSGNFLSLISRVRRHAPQSGSLQVHWNSATLELQNPWLHGRRYLSCGGERLKALHSF
ncbi:MAG: amidohydrolase [Bacteroidia bacterium]|nr:amidohydrolase [Bacteroidia bacterium]